MSTARSGQRILITGASRGIGLAAARLLATHGHRMVLAARGRAQLEQAAESIAHDGGIAEVLVMDLTDDASVQAAIASLEAGGPCDVLVNNAGTCDQAEFMLQDPAARRLEMELNYWGAQRVTAAVLPAMVRRGRGTIVNVSSLLGYVACPTTANYSASKAALNAWSHALRREVARFGVDVQVFVAPHTQTQLSRSTQFDGVRSLPVDYVAKELATAIARGTRQYAASPVYRAVLRLAGLFPELLEARLAATTQRLLSASPLQLNA